MIYKIATLIYSLLALHAEAKYNLVSTNDIDLVHTDLTQDTPLIDRLLLSTFLKSTALPQYTCNKVECLVQDDSCDPNDPAKEPCLYGYFCNATEKKCLEAPKAGENCTKDSDCSGFLAGAYCDLSRNECATPLTVDEQCDDKSVCPFYSECSSENQVCESKYQLGFNQECDETHKCKLNLICDNGKCVNLPKLNETCNVTLGCRPPYYCSVSRGNVCVDLMSLNESEPCVSSIYCMEDLICGRNGTCIKKVTDSFDKCSTHSDCNDDSYCNCDYKKGESKCKLITKSKESLKESFKLLAYCVNRQPDSDILRCEREILDVYSLTNENLLRGTCTYTYNPSDSIKKNPPAADLLVPIAFMIVLLIFIGVVLYDSKKSEKKKKST